MKKKGQKNKNSGSFHNQKEKKKHESRKSPIPYFLIFKYSIIEYFQG